MDSIDEGIGYHISECLKESITEFDRRFRHNSQEWDLVRRNSAITARNRFMQDAGVALGIPYVEMPLEVVVL